MHPVESFTYFTCVFTPLLFTAHPVHFLFIKLHADISPIPGHHVTSNDVCLAPASPTCETRCAQGYQSGDPSGQGKAYLKGQQFHWLHHHYFECNCTCQQLDPSHSQRSKEAAFCRRRLRPRAVRSHLRDIPQRQPGNRAGGGALRRSAGGAQGRRRQGQSGVSVVPPRPVFVFAQTVACCIPRTYCCCPAQQLELAAGWLQASNANAGRGTGCSSKCY